MLEQALSPYVFSKSFFSAPLYRQCIERGTTDDATAVICHRELGIIMQTYNSIFGTRFFLFKFLITSIAIIIGSRGVVLRSVHAMVVAPILVAMIFYTTQTMGILHEESAASERACAGMRRKDPYAHKCIKVYKRYIRANLGGCYHADSSLCLTVLDIIAQQTASLVLATMAT